MVSSNHLLKYKIHKEKYMYQNYSLINLHILYNNTLKKKKDDDDHKRTRNSTLAPFHIFTSLPRTTTALTFKSLDLLCPYNIKLSCSVFFIFY